MTKMLLFLSQQSLPFVINRIFKKLQIHPNFPFQNGELLAKEFLRMYLRMERFSFLYYVYFGPYKAFISRSAKNMCVEGLLCERHWCKALEFFKALGGSRKIPSRLDKFIPQLLIGKLCEQQRARSFQTIFSDKLSPLCTSSTPLAAYLLLSSMIKNGSWLNALEVLEKEDDLCVGTLCAKRDALLYRLVHEATIGANAQQWQYILKGRLHKNFWNELYRKYPINAYACMQTGQWKEALLRKNPEIVQCGVRAAVLAGNWQVAFRFHSLSHVISCFEELPYTVNVPLLAIFGVRWHSTGTSLKDKLLNNVFVPRCDRAHQRVKYRKILQIETVENFLEHEEKLLA